MEYTDRWIQISAIQKAVRRGMVEPAQKSAGWLVENDPSDLYRRLGVIALEEISNGDTALVQEYLACNTGEKRNRLWEFIERFCNARKDRVCCDLSLCLEYDPALEKKRLTYPYLSPEELKAIILDEGLSIYCRALSAWVLAGTRIFRSDKIRSNYDLLPEVMRCFRELKIDEEVMMAFEHASRQRLDSMAICLPFSFLLARESEQSTIEHNLDNVMIGDVPASSYDRHTRIGKSALHDFAFTIPIYETMEGKIKNQHMPKAVEWCVFSVEGAELNKQLVYTGYDEPQRIWLESFVCNEKFTPIDLDILLEAIKKNLAALNYIRAKKLDIASQGLKQMAMI